MIEIPVNPALPKQSLTIILEGTRYRLRILWNTRSENWTISIYSDDGTAIVTGCKITNQWPPFKGHEHTAGMPPGVIYVTGTLAEGRIGRDDFGTGRDKRLFYIESSEIAALAV